MSPPRTDAEPNALTNSNVTYLLGKLQDQNFLRMDHYYDQIYDPRYGHHFPYFTHYTMKTMLLDPRIRYGLALLKGPVIAYTKFFDSEESQSPDIHQAIVELNYHFPYEVKCEDKVQEQFIIDQLNRFWEVGLIKALTAIDWGYCGSEVQYQVRKGKEEKTKRSDGNLMCFRNLYLYPNFGMQAVTVRRGIVGFIRNNDRATYVPIGKGFWHTHQRERNHYYGESALKGAHVPWHETWSLGGARDIQRTWYFKNAYDGGEIYYPEGSYTDANGQKITHEDHAVRMLELKRSGSGMIFPSTTNTRGQREWQYEKPGAAVAPTGLSEYIQLLRDEELEGLGIPPEVVQSSGDTGMGSATGRMVPLMAFIASLTPIATFIISDFCEQILSVLLNYNNMKEDYTIRRIVPKTAEGQQQQEGGNVPVQEQTVKDKGPDIKVA